MIDPKLLGHYGRRSKYRITNPTPLRPTGSPPLVLNVTAKFRAPRPRSEHSALSVAPLSAIFNGLTNNLTRP